MGFRRDQTTSGGKATTGGKASGISGLDCDGAWNGLAVEAQSPKLMPKARAAWTAELCESTVDSR